MMLGDAAGSGPPPRAPGAPRLGRPPPAYNGPADRRHRPGDADGHGTPRSWPRRRSARLRNDPDVRPRGLPTLRVGLPGIVVGHRAGDDHLVALLPVDRRRDLVPGGQLQRVEDP